MARTNERHELIICIKNSRISIEVNPEVYDDYDFKEIRRIVKGMSREIWIDKTYVAYKGSRWENAFIVEKNWYKLTQLIWETELGKNVTADEKEEIDQSIMVIGLTYLYQVLESYGYECEHIDLSYIIDSFTVEYQEDHRTSWDF